MIQDIPYFLKNDKWWYYDYEEVKYKLTDNAPQEAKESYKEFYKDIDKDKKK